MEAKTVEQERPDSCKVSITSKGLFSGEVKVYAETADTARVEAINQAERLNDWLKKKNNGE